MTGARTRGFDTLDDERSEAAPVASGGEAERRIDLD